MQCPSINVSAPACCCDYNLPRVERVPLLAVITNPDGLPAWYPEPLQLDRNQVPLELYPLSNREQYVMQLYGTHFRQHFIAHLRRSRREGREMDSLQFGTFPDPGMYYRNDPEEDHRLAMRLRWKAFLSHLNTRP